jgi:hypothetical protein
MTSPSSPSKNVTAMSPRRVILLASLLLALGVVVWGPRLRVFWLQDKCLDAGGCWVFGENRCEFHDQSSCTSSRAVADH